MISTIGFTYFLQAFGILLCLFSIVLVFIALTTENTRKILAACAIVTILFPIGVALTFSASDYRKIHHIEEGR